MITFLDLESTGKWDYKAPSDAPHQPRIVQLAFLATEDDGKEIASVSTIIKPDGWKIDPGAQAVHGISDEKAMEVGIGIHFPLDLFICYMSASKAIVAHNIAFDFPLTRQEAIRIYGKEASEEMDGKKQICTMLAAMPICKIPAKFPKRGDPYKWPKLEEACRIILGREPSGAHDALADMRDCKDLYFAMLKTGAIKP